MNEDLEREAFYEWEGQNDISPLEAWLARAARAASPQSDEKITEQMVAECVTKWFPDRAYQASFFARALFSVARSDEECKAAPQATLSNEQRQAIEWAADRFEQDAIREADPIDQHDFRQMAETLRALLTQAPTERMNDAETECVHTWIPNSGRGGHPVFRPGRVSYYPIMHITCGKCNARTWVTEPEWKAKIERGEGQS